MTAGAERRFQQRVARAAEDALAERDVVAPIDVLVGLGWLAPRRVDEWRQGRVDCLETVVEAGLGKISARLSSSPWPPRCAIATPPTTSC
jgi:hypothetical protein